MKRSYLMLIKEIRIEEIKKIFGNQEVKKQYLQKLFEITKSTNEISRTNAGIDRQIIETWNYEVSIKILRELFLSSNKYKYCKECAVLVDQAIKSWDEKELGTIAWPFSAQAFDQRVHMINNSDMSEEDKDAVLCSEVIKFRRIKDINAKRNDFIEYLIFTYNDNVIPTFRNNRGVDFYINGEPFDQKVGKSVGKAFIEKYGDGYRQIAIENPKLVAISLYENQDENRFGDEPRLLIAYLDNDVTSDDIERCIKKADLKKPIQLEFDYFHSNNTTNHHITQCYVILLHK